MTRQDADRDASEKEKKRAEGDDVDVAGVRPLRSTGMSEEDGQRWCSSDLAFWAGFDLLHAAVWLLLDANSLIDVERDFTAR